MVTSPRVVGFAGAALVVTGVLASTSPASAGEPAGTAFGNPCGAVTILAVPGSTETSEAAGMDVVQGMLANATSRITDSADASIQVHNIGYPSTLFVDWNGENYFTSKDDGYQATWSTMNYYAQQCPSTSFILLGYSQGAHIAGDLAATVGKQGSPVDADRVRAVLLLADPARDPNFPVVGSGGQAGGVLGQRGDFGALDDRVTEYCNDQDAVCNSSFSSAGNSLVNGFGAHTAYGNTDLPGTDETYTQRITDDLVSDIVNLNDATY